MYGDRLSRGRGRSRLFVTSMLVSLLVLLLGTGPPPVAAQHSPADQPAPAASAVDGFRLLRLGRTAEAEAEFRMVLRDHPRDVDARIGLGVALTRRGAWRAALELLRATEADAGNNADLFAALARAYRRAGDDRRALEYFVRAKALAPGDPDIVAGYEAVAAVYGHSIAFEGFGNGGEPGVATGSGTITADVRIAPRVHLQAIGRTQARGGSDGSAGGGVFWRADRATTLGARAVGWHGNVSLPNSDVSGEVIRYAGTIELGAGLRRLSYAGTRVAAVSVFPAWDGGDRWRLDGRYIYSLSQFDSSGESSGDNSWMVRGTWRQWRRVALTLTYARGIESFEQLTADQLGFLNMTTWAGGTRVMLPSLTALSSGWEHERRSNSTTIDRFTVAVVQALP
jgi:hypothetical protein